MSNSTTLPDELIPNLRLNKSDVDALFIILSVTLFYKFKLQGVLNICFVTRVIQL